MIGDAVVIVTCDHWPRCPERVEIDLEAVSHGDYYYNETRVKERLRRLHWVLNDDGEFCSPECAEEQGGVCSR
jgi:hypothetical protein